MQITKGDTRSIGDKKRSTVLHKNKVWTGQIRNTHKSHWSGLDSILDMVSAGKSRMWRSPREPSLNQSTQEEMRSFPRNDGKITFMEVPMTTKLLLRLTRQTEDAAPVRS